MCGIAGFINLENGIEYAKRVNEIQSHRGPDSTGLWSDENIVFCHQRLSIIDIDSRSDQPFVKDGLIIVFNGELYNYKALKDELLANEAVDFKTNSDTEVVLELYRKYGSGCLSRMRGMFAFAIYDSKVKNTFLARDHFGIKPLFYTKIGNGFAFASELKSLVQIEGFDKTLNHKAFVESLKYLWVAGNHSMFEGTYKLAPASYMIINDELDIEVEKYWELSGQTHTNKDEQTVIKELQIILEDSIEHHMVADVDVSSFLSGGLDSSLISVMAKSGIDQLSTYTIGTRASDKKIEQMPEDEKYARKLANEQGFEYNEIVLEPNILDRLPEMVRHLDEPIGDPAALNTYLICKAASDRGVKVVLSGMGADEIFLGYRRQQATLLAEKYRSLPAFVKGIIRFVSSLLPVKIFGRGFRLSRWAKKFLTFADLPSESSYSQSYSYYNDKELSELLMFDASNICDQINQDHKEIFESKYQGDTSNQMCHTDIHMFMCGLNLTYTDRASMAASVEVRVPFIDKEVVEYAMSLEDKWKFRNSESKYILKKVAEQYLPEYIIYRPKAAFGAPIRSWISSDLAPLIDDLLSKKNIEKRGLLNPAYVSRLIEENKKGIKDHAYRIYQLITLELWMREFLD